MPLTPDEVRKYGIMNMSEDESDLEDWKCEANPVIDNANTVGSCITFNLCRVYKRKNSKGKYEIGTLHTGNIVKYCIEKSGGGWFKVLDPIPGWIQYEELSQPELTSQEQTKLEKNEKAKEMAMDLTPEASGLTSVKSKDVEKTGKIKSVKKVDDLGSSKEEKVESKIGTVGKKKIESSMNKAIEETTEIVETLDSEREEECTDDD